MSTPAKPTLMQLLAAVEAVVGKVDYANHALAWTRMARSNPAALVSALDALAKCVRREPVKSPGAWLNKKWQHLNAERQVAA